MQRPGVEARGDADTQPDSAGPMPTRSRERRGPFGLQGRRTEGLPDGSPQEEGEAGQVLGGAELRRSGRPGYPGGPCAGHPGPRGPRGGRADPGSSCPGAQTPRTRTALACRRSTAGPGWKSRRPGGRRIPQKLEPPDPMKAPVAPQDRLPADLPRPQERRLPPMGRPEYRRLAKGRPLDRDRPRPPEVGMPLRPSRASRRPAPRSRSRSSTRGFRFQARPR
jgi:hypothetical protein